MATVEQYQEGKAARAVRQAYDWLQIAGGDPAQQEIGRVIIDTVNKMEPILLSQERAEELIRAARALAVGDRVCRCAFPDSPQTSSVFVDELAEGMIQVGKAEPVGVEEALATLAQYPGQPLVGSKVAPGRYQEICRTFPEHCVYWNLERRGVSVLRKK